jgi:predicted metal-dependent hydrolase
VERQCVVIKRDATLTAVIPPGTDTETLVKVVRAKRQWLYAKLRERAETGQAGPPRH